LARRHPAGPADPATAPAALRDADGPEGNERLTALTGGVLLLLFAAEGVTILSLRSLLTWHFFIGLLLIGPVCLKLGSTGYRFLRYYSGSPAYRRKGPPAPLLRLLGPLVVLTSVAVLGTGVLLGLVGGRSLGPFPLLLLHKASFLLWAGVMSVHVLAYIWRLPGLITADLRRGSARHSAQRLAGAGVRWALLAASLAGGLVLAFLGAPLAAHWL
jgi:hypothetical protein